MLECLQGNGARLDRGSKGMLCLVQKGLSARVPEQSEIRRFGLSRRNTNLTPEQGSDPKILSKKRTWDGWHEVRFGLSLSTGGRDHEYGYCCDNLPFHINTWA